MEYQFEKHLLSIHISEIKTMRYNQAIRWDNFIDIFDDIVSPLIDDMDSIEDLNDITDCVFSFFGETLFPVFLEEEFCYRELEENFIAFMQSSDFEEADKHQLLLENSRVEGG